jgi:DNA-binding MarR family transcriptional regulator
MGRSGAASTGTASAGSRHAAPGPIEGALRGGVALLDDAVSDEAAGRLFVALARLTRLIRRSAPVALSEGSVTALATVVNEGPIRVGDLAVWEGVRAPTMTRIVDGLVVDGYAERIPDPADGRACLVRATPAGIEILRGARTARAQVLAAGLDRLSGDQRAALVSALPAIEALYADEPPPPV